MVSKRPAGGGQAKAKAGAAVAKARPAGGGAASGGGRPAGTERWAIARHVPWNDRAGRFSWLKTCVFVALFIPAALILATLANAVAPSAPAGNAAFGDARPVTIALHSFGDWSVRLLLLSLAVTPAMRLLRRPRLILVRRMIGVAAFLYAASHFTLYVVDQKFDLARVASEIALRFYLTVGFVTLVGLAVLAATSVDAVIRKMGARRWQALHRLVYPLTVLALFHFYLQTRLDVSEPVLMTGLFLWLMGFRLIARRSTVPVLLILAVAVALLTGAVEVAWYGLATSVAPARVIAADLSLAAGIRPVWWVLMIGVAIALGVAVLNRSIRSPQVNRAARAE